jgi:hypothetical protein
LLIVVGVVRDTFFNIEAELKLHGYDDRCWCAKETDARLRCHAWRHPAPAKAPRLKILRKKLKPAAHLLGRYLPGEP